MLGNLPARGWDRQRKKKQTVAEKLAAASQNSARLSRYAQSGQSRGRAQSIRPWQSSRGARWAAQGRSASPIFAALRGVGVSGRFGEVPMGGGPAQRAALPPQAPTQAQIAQTLGGPPAGPPAGPPGPLGSPFNATPELPPWANPSPSGVPQVVNNPATGDFIQGLGLGSAPQSGGFTNTQTGGQVGNFIPLGGGLYMDGMGNIFGAGGV